MTGDAASVQEVTDLAVGGMTCAACVKRVEKKLAKLDGAAVKLNPAAVGGQVVLDIGSGS